MLQTTLANIKSGDVFSPDNGATWIATMNVFYEDTRILIVGEGDRVKANRYWGYTSEEVIVKV